MSTHQRPRRLSRRAAIGLGAGFTGAAFLGSLNRALAAGEQVSLLGVFPSSGAYAVFGRDTDRGIKLALAQFNNTVLGQKVTYLTRDSQTNPGIAVQRVSDAIDHENVKFFIGVASSAVALALEPIAKQKQAVFITSVGADEVTGKDCNEYTFRWSVPTYGAVRSTMYPFIKANPGAKKWYTITPSYVFGDSLLRNVKEVAQEKGLELIGNDYHPLGASDFSSYITKAIEAKPDVVALLNFGGDAIKSIKTAASYGLKKNAKILYVWSGGLLDYGAIGSDALDGVYVGCQYWHEASAATRKASEPYQKAYGEPMGYVGASAYIEAWLVLKAIELAKSSDPLKVAKALESFKYAGPTGPEQVRAFDHQVVKPYYLLRGKAQSAMKDQWDFVETLAESSYPVPRGVSECHLS
ncbi:ABC transporter substrate-binding protein [bacterium]|nr:MAG: ABC transporter substrate-binding protein [bacterium]